MYWDSKRNHFCSLRSFPSSIRSSRPTCDWNRKPCMSRLMYDRPVQYVFFLFYIHFYTHPERISYMSAKGYNHLDIHLYTHPFIIPSFHKAMGEFWSNPLGWLVTFFSINESIYTILYVGKKTIHIAS
jgi:hypothetical protein